VSRPLLRIAIANRGEAASRCIRALRGLRALERAPLRAIALYTEVDRDAHFVRHADAACRIHSPAGAVAAYLDVDEMIRALRAVRADAVWPGWGFAAESPEFVERLDAEGIVFLGPTAEAMRSVGDKITAKQLAESVGVPVTPWSGGALADEAEALAHARRIGFPLVVKASAGGGGRGIRMVDGEDELAEAFRSARAEAENAFGDGRLFVEQRVSGGRHIEVQIAADHHGKVVALGCRDCSVQRRHQKVLEEAPPFGLDPVQRRAIEEAAVRIAGRVGYRGVGTVEFLANDGGFTFLEVNPRLQVEHGITEALTGIDLVQLQIRIARGESVGNLPVEERGFAIEARVCAEDPDEGFLPAPGRIVRFEPALGSRVRIDTGVVAGSVVPPDFDSLVAKVIATGDDREEALANLACALQDTELVIEGGASNKGYLLEVLEAPEYRAGGVDTAWLDRWNAQRAGGAAGAGDDPATAARARDGLLAAAILAYQRARAAARANFYADTANLSPDRTPRSEGQQIDLSLDGESYRLDVYAIGNWRYRVHLDGTAVTAAMREEGRHAARLLIDERTRRILYDASDLGLRVEVDGHPMRFGWQTAGQVRASTPAMLVSVQVEVGDRVESGQLIGLLEAMKTEIGFFAPVSGVVTEVVARPGQQVAAGEVILVIDPAGEEEVDPATRERLSLPPQVDSLAMLFRPEGEDPLAHPDLMGAAATEGAERQRAIATLRDELRRALLGYDLNPERAEKLVAFLETPLPDDLPESFRRDLAGVCAELSIFADVESLFIRAPRASVSGGIGPSNNARMRMYVRRLHASGSGIAPEFLDLVRAALSHYGVTTLEPTDALERAVLRLVATQLSPDLRISLVFALLSRLTDLAKSGFDLSSDRALGDALERIARMRGLLPDSVADAAIEASYVIFQEPELERDAERTSMAVESWLAAAAAEAKPSEPPGNVLLELAVAPRRVFERVGHWIGTDDAARREIAMAAHVQRLYSPRIPSGQTSLVVDGSRIRCMEYPEIGLVVSALSDRREAPLVAEHLCEAEVRLRAGEGESGPSVHALELFVSDPDPEARDDLLERLRSVLAETRPAVRFTVTLASKDGEPVHHTFVSSPDGPVERDDHGLHPETVERIDLARLRGFELERLPSEEGIYAFHGRSREVSGDERVFVLADVRGRSPLAGHQAAVHLPLFERAFDQATRRLRGILQFLDPRRRLQWNRIVLFVAPEIYLEPETATQLARRLAPLTRHLGLEKVLVRLKLLESDAPDRPARPVEVVIVDSPGAKMELSWRDPHRDPLQPAREYERRVVEARRRRLVYPYEIVRMLTSGAPGVPETDGEPDEAQDGALPGAVFEEYDLDAAADRPTAVSVAGRAPGRNESGIVFGLIRTPTAEVPEGMERVLVLSDPTMGMGALAAPECDRLVAALDLAETRGIPVEWIPVSSGARIAMDSGTENLDATARVVRRIVTFTQAGGTIHLIVQGVNVGAQSYFDALSTMLMHTRGVLIMTPGASMVLTGRAALEASGAVAAEDEVGIGGFERIMGPNGQAQYYARSLADAYEILHGIYRVSYVVPGESRPRRIETRDPADRDIGETRLAEGEAEGFKSVGEIFDPETNPGRKRPFPMRAVMDALCDEDGVKLERWGSMVGAETAIVWDAHLGGHPVTLIGIESQNLPREGYRPLDGPESWSGGTLFPLSSKKAARAINSASGNRPVVVLANLSGFDGSPESMRKLQLEYGAEIARAVVNFEGPILFLVVSRYHGGAYVVFSQELNDGLEASALEGSYASVIGGGPAAAVVFAREVRARAVADPRVQGAQRRLALLPTPERRENLDRVLRDVTLEKQAELAAEFDQIHSVERALEVGSLRSIWSPTRMRAHLIERLDATDH
jgi:acetyl/propionyl-CoA carboxylase alpha subunit/acetyl-CoA carboxylase carboxyltransferase component